VNCDDSKLRSSCNTFHNRRDNVWTTVVIKISDDPGHQWGVLLLAIVW